MDDDGMIQSLIKRLNIEDESDKTIIRKLYGEWMDKAKSICNRADVPPAMRSIVRDVTASAYNRIGDEGAHSTSVGGQTISYTDLNKSLTEQLILAGLRYYPI